ncbi:MAG: glycosyltransferase family 4 protein [Fibrobacter sp.]|nr:glycosyltransferase family 4 protein [Fibrobacter sp.]
MRILIIKSTSGFVDIEKNNAYNLQEIGLARAFNRMGHKCDVVYYGGYRKKIVKIKYNEEGDTFDFYYLRSISILRNAIYFGLGSLIKKYDIVHCGGYDMLLSWLLAKRIPEKLVVYHGTYYSDFNVKYNKKCKVVDRLFLPRYKKYETVFDTKSSLAKSFLIEKGLKNVFDVGVGLDLSIIESKAVLESELSNKIKQIKKDGFFVLLYIGRIEPRRNITFLFDILRELKDCGEKVKLVIIGKGQKDYVTSCFSYAKQQDVYDDIIYNPFVDQRFLKGVYELSDVFLLPTKYEIYGMVLLEAMYFGIPVITTLNGGSSMMVKDGENGIIVDRFDEKKWASRIKAIFSDVETKKMIAENAHKTIERTFTWDALALKFLEIFKQTKGLYE